MKSVLYTSLLLFHLNFSSSTNMDNCYTANELSETLLELLTIVVRGGVLDLSANLANSALDVILLASSVDDGGVILVNNDALSLTTVSKSDVLKLDAKLLSDATSASEDSDILKHRLTTITEAWSLNSTYVKHSADSVNNEGSESLTFDIFSDDKKWLTSLSNLLENREEVLDAADLLLVNKNESVL
jgi:hypothetical protein